MGESSLLLADNNNNLFYVAQNKPYLYYISGASSGVQNTIIGRNGHHQQQQLQQHNHTIHNNNNNSNKQHHIGSHSGNQNNNNNKSRNRSSAVKTRDNNRQAQPVATAGVGVASLLGGNINSLSSLSSLIGIMHGSQTLQQTQHAMQQSLNNHTNVHVGIAATTGGVPHPANTASIADYLAQLIKDRKQLAAFPNVFLHVERILDEGEWGKRSRKVLLILQ